jgi:hypothetical protein
MSTALRVLPAEPCILAQRTTHEFLTTDDVVCKIQVDYLPQVGGQVVDQHFWVPWVQNVIHTIHSHSYDVCIHICRLLTTALQPLTLKVMVQETREDVTSMVSFAYKQKKNQTK